VQNNVMIAILVMAISVINTVKSNTKSNLSVEMVSSNEMKNVMTEIETIMTHVRIFVSLQHVEMVSEKEMSSVMMAIQTIKTVVLPSVVR
jgi:hypothetical protein